MEGTAEAIDERGLLRSWRDGDLQARDQLFERLYPELKRAAAALLRREKGLSLSTRDLIHEAVERLVTLNRMDWQDRAHFLALSARMMRRALLDHVRAKRRLKREHHRVELVTGIGAPRDPDVEELSDALDRLAAIDRERAEIVEMRFFGGLEITEIAVVTGLSEATVKRRWASARLWLLEALRA